MQKEGFKGLFGIDFIIRDSDIFIIEINARQTANIAMQTKLELKNNFIPLSLLHIAEFMGIKIDFHPLPEIAPLSGSQVFLRAKYDNFKVNNNLSSGMYKLKDDRDKSLLWQKDEYSIDKVNSGFILIFQKKGLIKNNTEELARMQFSDGIVHYGKMSKWILDTMKQIEYSLK